MSNIIKYAKSVKCPVCNAIVRVRKVAKVPVRLTRALALANHAKTIGHVK